jgi:hypothetical protein
MNTEGIRTIFVIDTKIGDIEAILGVTCIDAHVAVFVVCRVIGKE